MQSTVQLRLVLFHYIDAKQDEYNFRYLTVRSDATYETLCKELERKLNTPISRCAIRYHNPFGERIISNDKQWKENINIAIDQALFEGEDVDFTRPSTTVELELYITNDQIPVTSYSVFGETSDKPVTGDTIPPMMNVSA